MPLNGPLPNNTRSEFADWLELVVLSGRNAASQGDLFSLLDLAEEDTHYTRVEDETGQELEMEILESDREDVSGDVLDELGTRAAALQTNYPFEVNLRGSKWQLERAGEVACKETLAARACYSFCLLASAIRDQRLSGTGVNSLTGSLADHFQAIATAAAAGLLRGKSIWFGWPRPDNSDFLNALKNVVSEIKMGQALDRVPLFSKGQSKDAGIDVIAWHEFSDSQPGKLMLFGQVASGRNWMEKSIILDIENFLSWFSQRPTKHFIPAIFIPFPQHHGCTGRKDAYFSSVAREEAWHREQKFGLVIDRLRIVSAAARPLVTDGDPAANKTLKAVEDWVSRALAETKSSTR